MKFHFSDKDWFRLYRYGLFLTNNNEDTKDLVQEALCKALEKVDLNNRRFSIPYIKKIMKNHFIDEKKEKDLLFLKMKYKKRSPGKLKPVILTSVSNI